MFDLDFTALKQKGTVNATECIIEDTRTGHRFKKMFYRPGSSFDISGVSKELAPYGYKLVTIGDTTAVKGILDWAMIWGKFAQQEEL